METWYKLDHKTGDITEEVFDRSNNRGGLFKLEPNVFGEMVERRTPKLKSDLRNGFQFFESYDEADKAWCALQRKLKHQACMEQVRRAAPDLLEALEYAMPYLEACVPEPRNGANGDVNCVARARAAIAKAKGQHS